MARTEYNYADPIYGIKSGRTDPISADSDLPVGAGAGAGTVETSVDTEDLDHDDEYEAFASVPETPEIRRLFTMQQVKSLTVDEIARRVHGRLMHIALSRIAHTKNLGYDVSAAAIERLVCAGCAIGKQRRGVRSR